jgi:P27 family predicted phage terminase small subunit
MPRPSKPTHLRLVQGTLRANRHAIRAEPAAAPVLETPEPPAHLPGQAAECWRRVVPLLSGMGVLADTDILAVERLCMCWQELQDADLALEMLGGTTYESRSAKNGFMRRSHPEVAQRADAERRLLALFGQFGLTPSARARLAVPGGNAKADKLNKYFA